MNIVTRTLLSSVALIGLSALAEAQTSDTSLRNRPLSLQLAPKPATETSFRPLAILDDRAVLRGELASDERAIYLTQAEALRATAFRLTYGNAVSNLPEGSRILLRINDQTIGEARQDATNAAARVVIPIPLGVMTAGYNAVRLVAQQRHRVDCSVNASYELWSEINLSESGLIGLAPAASIQRMADLPALAASGAERTPIRLRIGDAPDTLVLDRAMRAANALIIAGGIQRPRIEIGDEPGKGPGIDLIVGGDVPPGAVQLESDLGLFYSGEAAGRSVLTVRPIPGADIETTLRRMLDKAKDWAAVGSNAGRRALLNTSGRRATSDSSFSFTDLGVESRVFDGSLQQSAFGFNLPADFFAAPYGSASLTLDSAFAGEAGLGKQISIRVNDQLAAVVPIQKRGSAEFDQRRVELPMQMFKPGYNAVSVDASLMPAGRACDATAGTPPQSRLTINGSSRISFGQLARVSVLPNLSATLTSGYPHSGQAEPATVAVSAMDPRYLSAAMTWLGQMTASSGTPMQAAFRFGPLDDASESGLFFGPPSQATQTLARNASRRLLEVRPAQVASANVGDQPSSTSQADSQLANTERSWLDKLQLSGAADLARDVLRGDLGRVTTTLQDFGLVERSRAARVGAAAGPASEQDLTVLQDVTLLGKSEPWQNLFGVKQLPPIRTMVLASDPDRIEALIDQATSRHFWTRFNGESAVVRPTSWGPENQAAVQQAYIGSGDFSPANLRLTLAGWFALNQGYYLGGLAILALMLALTTAAVLRTRRQ